MSLTISIDCTSISQPPLVMSAEDDGTVWGILPGFTLPGKVARIQYATSAFMHGAVATGSTWQQAQLAFDCSPTVATASGLAAQVARLEAALGQFAYETTVTLNGIASVWKCDMGSIAPAALDVNEVEFNDQAFSVTIPCYPVGA